MTERALVLGGGGAVGVAWEAGLLAGLMDEGVDVRQADFVQGTSAGSIVGSAVATGVDPGILAQAQLIASAGSAAPAVAPDLTPIITLMQKMPATGEPGRELLREIGALSLSTTHMSEQAFVAMISGALVQPSWPGRFACTAVDAETGEFRLWRAADGVELASAISASCSVPGIFPPVTIDGRRWMDGGMRSSISIDMAAGYRKVLAVAVIPKLARAVLGPRLEAEAAVVQAARGEVMLIAPDDASAEAFGPNLMDSARRPVSMEAGRAQGRREAARLRGWW